jgi:hypothetical protein
LNATTKEIDMTTNSEAALAVIATAVAALDDTDTPHCPYCGSDQVEHIDAVDTSDWQSEIEKWGCKMPTCKTRTFWLCYVLERGFRGIRVDTDKFKTLHRPLPEPEPVPRELPDITTDRELVARLRVSLLQYPSLHIFDVYLNRESVSAALDHLARLSTMSAVDSPVLDPLHRIALAALMTRAGL